MTTTLLIGWALALATIQPQEQPEVEPPPGAHADYIEYRSQPELGQISVFTGVVNGAKTTRRLRDGAAELAKRGILVCSGDAPRSLRRAEKIAGRAIVTSIVAEPLDAGDPTSVLVQRVVVTVDGRKKIDCSLGEAQEVELIVYGVQIFPEDGLVVLTASDLDGHDLVIPESQQSLDDGNVITDESFRVPPDADPTDTPALPQRA